MELGITGGEEDGVNNEDANPEDLYSKPEDHLVGWRQREKTCHSRRLDVLVCVFLSLSYFMFFCLMMFNDLSYTGSNSTRNFLTR